MKMRREWAMPNSETFSVPVIGDFVKSYLHGVSIDPFARDKEFATYTNDLNQNTKAKSHLDAVDFLMGLSRDGVQADVLILDPPYSPRQVSECYADIGIKATAMDTSANFYARMRHAARGVCKIGTVVLSFGWNSTGMGKGFEPLELLLVAHGGSHNDTICFAERMIQKQDDLF
jgi:hypothetical protein